jgi:hypothetical protein
MYHEPCKQYHLGNNISVADSDHFDADPDPTSEKPDADPDPIMLYQKFCNKIFLL